MTGHRSGWSRYERLLLDHSAQGAELARRGREVRESTVADPAVASVVTGVVAPLALGLDVWVRRHAAENDIRRLYYLARNARVLYDVAVARRRLENDVELGYLTVSRDLVRGASLAAVSVETWFEAGTATPSSFLLQSLEGQDPHTLLRRLGLDPERDRGLLLRSGVYGADGDVALDPDVLLQHGQLRDVICHRAACQIELARRYFAGEGLDSADNVGLVDIGWQGQQAAMIEAILSYVRSSPALHLHVGGYRPQNPVHPVRIEHWLFENSPPAWLASPVPLFETLLPSIGPAARALDETATGEVTVCFAEEPTANSNMDRAIRELTARVASAVEPRLFGNESPDLGPVVLELARQFWVRPTVDEATAWGRRKFERDGSGAMLAELGAPIHVGDLWALARRKGSAKRVWPEGAIAASGAPIRSALTPIRRSSQSLRRGVRTVSRRG